MGFLLKYVYSFLIAFIACLLALFLFFFFNDEADENDFIVDAEFEQYLTTKDAIIR